MTCHTCSTRRIGFDVVSARQTALSVAKQWPGDDVVALQAVDAASRNLQHELSATTELLAADAGRLSRELAGVRADVSSLAGGLQQQQHELGVLQPRVGRLETLESSNPRASLRLVTALEGKLDNLAAQHVRGVVSTWCV
jgi:hypothetical protein